ncbi:hypothetical protein LTR78_001614 [Recurvomyces mirabilis]|uniref:Mid2 domain-containing protein n=1 Tax=Recurvomyces mirabilis TaxID=574656 RepID=A0AAE1C533_9PEZI|nr:hypothetical protein LTR78_001614 [Recurvomyces mirabilis]KAK5151814.1 hypothetical protein LTS14_008948 [Recurvomyces mirabilis]
MSTTSSLTSPTSSASSTSTTGNTNSPSPTTHSASSTVTSYGVITDIGGSLATVTLVTTVQGTVPTDKASTYQTKSPSSNHPALIVGLAVGIPVGLLACALLAYVIWRQRKSKGQEYTSPPRSDDTDDAMKDRFGYQVGHVAPDGRAPEIDSYPVAMSRSRSNRKSELEGSTHSPAISVGSATHLPGYSPMSPGLRSVNEEPAELWGGPTVTQIQEEEPKIS